MKFMLLLILATSMFGTNLVQGQISQQVVAIQYYFDSDPGVGVTGNGDIIPVSPSEDLNQNFTVSIPGSLSKGFHHFYLRARDEIGRWSMVERRLFYLTELAESTTDIVAYQWYIDIDPGTGVTGNGAIVPIASTSDYTNTVSVVIPPSLNKGFHQLYIRTKDESGRWSLAERQLFYTTELAAGTSNIVAYQWYIDNDPGVGVAGNGSKVPVTSTASFENTISLVMPESLTKGIHNLYIRAQDEDGRWSLAERRTFYLTDIASGTENINAYAWFIDNDPGVGVPGNGTIVTLSSSDSYNNSVLITLPGALSKGIHQFYFRMKNEGGTWSVAERRMFYVSDVVENTIDVTALEFYFDTDPGVGNANSYPVTPTNEFNQIVDLGVPCLSAGTHYLYIRAKDSDNRWSIIARDTFFTSSGIEPSIVTPSGPLTICEGSNVILSTTPVNGVTYQWVKEGVPITGETNASLTVSTSGSYALRTICGSFVLSNTVEVSIQLMNTYYSDADNDGYGNNSVFATACIQPSGYVENNNDCDDTNSGIHPGAFEVCNLIDDDCDGLTDESVETTFYADADNDGFGDSSFSENACNAPAGFVSNSNDCNDTDPLINPNAPELCNEMDDNCNGLVDEGVQSVFYADSDNDGFGDPDLFILACETPAGYVTNQSDCDDGSASVYPGATESCNSIDDDCDNEVDEGFVISVSASSVSSSLGNEFCFGNSTELSVQGGMLGTDAIWKWYEGDCGISSPIGSGNTILVTPSDGLHHYFVRAEGTCNTTVCASISITVFAAPSTELCPSFLSFNTEAALCNASPSYSLNFSGNPMPDLTYVLTGATENSGSGTGAGSLFNVGETTVTVTAENLCGFLQCEFEIAVTDNESPIFDSCPLSPTTSIEPGQWGAHVEWSVPDVLDNCGVQSLTSNYEPGDFFVVGSTAVIYTVTDIHGNSNSCYFNVVVQEPEIIEPVNISIFADDIAFSDIAPDTGAFITVSADIHNSSGVDASAFWCRLINQFDGTIYADSLVPGLQSEQVTTVSWVIETPESPAFVPMQIIIDQLDNLNESNEFDNSAIRPFINGAFSLDAEINLTVYPQTPTIVAGNVIQLCGDAEYDNTALPLADYSVAGAQVTIEILETGQILTGTTDSEGHFCIGYTTPHSPGALSFTAEVTDFTLIGNSDTSTFNVTPPVILCPTDLSVSIKLFSSNACGNLSEDILIEDTPVMGQVTIINDCADIAVPSLLFVATSGNMSVSGPFTIPSLLPGQQFVFNIPAITFNTSGTGFVTAVVDYSNIVMEGNESNNTASKIFQVQAASPDIMVTHAGFNSTVICQVNEVSADIRNQGGGSTGPFEVSVDITENQIVVASYLEQIENLDPFCSTTLSYTFVPTAGNDYEIHVESDVTQTVAELNESNNSLNRELNLDLCAPDLVLYDCAALDVKPADVQFPGSITLTAQIANEGVGPSISPFEVWFNISGTIYPLIITETIEINEVKTVSVSVPSPATGNNIVVVTVDPLEEIMEGNESNNTLSNENQLLCYDFTLVNFRCDDIPSIPGKQGICHPADLGIAVHNKTLYEATSLTIRYEISGPGLPSGWSILGDDTHYMGNTCVCPLYLKFSELFNYPATGLYSIRVTADPGNIYEECNEGNNQIIISVNVLDAADYTTYSHYISPSLLNPEVNESVTFNLTYENQGCSGDDSLEIMLQVDNMPFDSLTASPIDSGSFNTYPFPDAWSSGLSGLHIARFIVDNDDDISEINESNNMATRALIVGTPPDFHVIDLIPSSIIPLLGENISLTASVSNEGGSDVNGKIRFFYIGLSGNEIPIHVRSVYIPVGDTIEITIPWSVINPYTKLIVRAGEADPEEFDFTDNEAEGLLNPLSLTLDITDNACFSLDEGTIEVQPTGGKEPYFIQWSNGRNDFLIEATAGIYTVTVTDSRGYVATALGEIVVLGFPETRYRDFDNDGFGNSELSILSCDVLPGYVMNGDDCNDLDATRYPGAQEICNGVDDDCDDLVDDEDADVAGQITWYFDGDSDGFGRIDSLQHSCTQPVGFVGNGNDCDDTSGSVHPDATEILDNEDNDCDGLVDEELSSLSVDAGDCEVVLFGYSESACHVLSVIASGGAAPYSYQWSNSATTVTTTVCPEVTTTYEIVVTDNNGFTAVDNVTVQVINVTCGNNNNKVLVCHIPPGNPQDAEVICIAPSAIPAHLDHGCYVGVCDGIDPCEEASESVLTLPADSLLDNAGHQFVTSIYKQSQNEELLLINPNPADVIVEIHTSLCDAILSVTDISGKIILRKTIRDYDCVVNTSSLVEGIYFISVENEANCIVKSIVVMH